MMKGTVSYVGGNDWNGKTLHSFRLNGDNAYYNCGTVAPAISKGQLIEFDAIDKGNGKFQVNVSSINVLKDSVTEVVTGNRSGFRKTFGKSPEEKGYWERREERDIVTQTIIQLQSSRNSAIAMADYLVKHGALDLEKLKGAKRQTALTDLVEELTIKFEEQAVAKRQGEVVSEPEIVEEPAVEADEWS